MVRFRILGIIASALCLIVTGCQNNQINPSEVDNLVPTTTITESKETSSGVPEASYVYGEIIYVPIYSSIFHYKGVRTYDLSATLSIHNIDMEKNILVKKVDYYDTDGELIKHFIENDIILKPFQTVHFVIEEDDTSGGTGANFLVEWASSSEVCSPIVEAVMISTSGQQGISFTTEGKVIKTLHNE